MCKVVIFCGFFLGMDVAFVSGHLDLDVKQFETYYIPQIQNAIARGVSKFLVGDAPGVDTMTQHYLLQIGQRVVVYHLLDVPRINVGKFETVGNFKNETSRDAAMTKDSTFDILWVRSTEECQRLFGSKFNPKRVSGTEKNRLRRLQQK